MAENGNGSAKITWWILGIGSSVAVLFISLLIGKLEKYDARIRDVEIHQSNMERHIANLEFMLKLVNDKVEDSRK